MAEAAADWFVVNVADAEAFGCDGLGYWIPFESGDAPFPEVGINIHVLQPGEPNAMYHAEDAQEGFLVLHGECLLLVEGEERRLRAWDFVHCPNWTKHVFVGAGDGPCAILMVGTRKHEAAKVVYPVAEVALRHGAGVQEETEDGRVAYARYGETTPRTNEDARLPWNDSAT